MLVTALITPFLDGGTALDLEGWQRLVRFQLDQGVDQVLLFGTTGEGAALSEVERAACLAAALEAASPHQLMLAVGPGRPEEMGARGRAALAAGVRDLLVVDCPYAAPSSSALRTAWYGPLAAALPDARIWPYAVPSRTGTELLPDDLARLVEDHPNVVGVKDATGRLGRMVHTRSLLGDEFTLLCGDDGHLLEAVLDGEIRAQGGCSVASNLVPAAVVALLAAARAGQRELAATWNRRISAAYGLVAVSAPEPLVLAGQRVDVPQKVRNPVPLKSALASLGLVGGPCRPPYDEPGPRAAALVRGVLDELRLAQPDLLAPARAALARASVQAPERVARRRTSEPSTSAPGVAAAGGAL